MDIESLVIKYSGFSLLFAFFGELFIITPNLQPEVNQLFVIHHAIFQTLIFVNIAHVPAHIFEKMWFVDIAWPAGLVAMAAHCYLSVSATLKGTLICACVLFQGGRMLMGGIQMVLFKHWSVDQELQRYEYQRIKYEEKHGKESFGMSHIHREIYFQAMANYGSLVIPILLVCNDRSTDFNLLEIFGFMLWGVSYIWETVADSQKLNFVVKMAKQKLRKQVCNVGLWRYCRHPNYFGEWMVWNSIILIALPSIFRLNLDIASTLCLLIITSSISGAMWFCLTIWTGAKPAEYFSVQHRPDYKLYQETTNMMIPWFPKTKTN